jgi:hypothetical protein
MSKTDGGQAFPCGPIMGASFPGQDGMTIHQFSGSGGMSLRAYLAGQALAGSMGSPDIMNRHDWANRNAVECVEAADALIAALEKPL